MIKEPCFEAIYSQCSRNACKKNLICLFCQSAQSLSEIRHSHLRIIACLIDLGAIQKRRLLRGEGEGEPPKSEWKEMKVGMYVIVLLTSPKIPHTMLKFISLKI